MKRLVFVITSLLCALTGMAQNTNVYRRTVVDEQARPLDYFNAIVQNPADSTYLKGDTFFGGKLEMQHDFEGRRRVLLQSLGYEDLSFIEDFSAPSAPDTLVMKNTALSLDAVVVSGRVPAVSTSQGKTVVRVAGSSLQNLPEVTDILRRAPGVRVAEGGITVFGKGTPQVFIDGREASYDELQMLQPQQIISIEVDSNPSARYDASYASVVRVKTTKAREGISGQIANHSYQGRRYINSTAAQLQIARKNWVNLFSYSYTDQRSHNYTRDTEAIHLQSNPLSDSIYSDDLSRSRLHSVLWGSTVDITPRHQLSWQYSGAFRKANNRGIQQERIRQSGVLQLMESEDLTKSRRQSHSANVRYKFAVDSVRTLEVTADWARSTPRSNEAISQHYIESGDRGTISIDNRSLADVFSAKAEYTMPLLGANLLLGTRYGRIDSRTTSVYNDKTTVTLLENDNFAAYATLGRDYDKWGWSAGLRGEFLNDDIRVGGETLRKGWQNNLFPSVEFYTSELTKNLDLSLSYTSRIQRPSVSELNPSASYVNSVVTGYGNPLLLSTVSHNLMLGLTLWKNLSLSLSANYILNPSVNAGELAEEGDAINFLWINIPRSRYYLADATYNNSWGPVSLTLNSGIGFTNTKIPYLGKETVVGGTVWYANINTDVKLAKNTSLTAGFEYTSHNYYLMTVTEPYNDLTIGATQYLFDRRLQLSLTGSDLLRGANPAWHDRYGFYETSQRSSYDTRRVRFSVRWLFNNHKAKYNERARSEEFDRIN